VSVVARPRKEIDSEQFEKLCALQCTLQEIANWFGCSEDTIERWCQRTYTDENGQPMGFADAYKNYSVDGKISLRRFQFKMAERNPSMAIWLGKQWLGQRDNIDVGMDVNDRAREVEALDAYFANRNKNGAT
jgi:hypothetical protein